MLFKQVEKNIIKHKMLPESGSILFAVSGGVDSTVMAHIVSQIASKNGLSVVVCHLNHMFRGEEADRDESFVDNLAKELNAQCVLKRVDLPKIIKNSQGGSAQNISRGERLKFFQEVASRFNCSHVFVAHNLDDVSETFFMRLFRGSGTMGLRSIQFTSRYKELTMCRPILDVSRVAIEKYAKDCGIKFVEDSSNRTDKYDRNKLRLNILPQIKKDFNPNLANTVKTVTDLIGEDEDYFDSVVEQELLSLVTKRSDREITIKLSPFLKLHNSIKTRIVRALIKEFKGDLFDISYVNVMDVLKISGSTEKRKEITLPSGLKAKKLNLTLTIGY